MIYNYNTNVSNVNNNIDKITEIYKAFNLITKKILVLEIEKTKREYDDFIVAKLPQPTLIIESYKGYFIGWAIEGTIKTKAQKNFYKDLLLRLKKTFLVKTNLLNIKISSIWHLQYAIKDGVKIINNSAKYKMKNLAGCCVSLTAKEEKDGLNDINLAKEEFKIYAGTYSKTEDSLFDFIRHRAYDYARIYGANRDKIDLENLENYCIAIAEIGYQMLGNKKGISTAFMKAKNIANWVYNNYGNGKRTRKIKNDKDLEMTRRENIIRINKTRAEDRKLRVKQAIENLKSKEEKISVRKVATYANISTKTAQKYLKQFKNEGII